MPEIGCVWTYFGVLWTYFGVPLECFGVRLDVFGRPWMTLDNIWRQWSFPYKRQVHPGRIVYPLEKRLASEITNKAIMQLPATASIIESPR